MAVNEDSIGMTRKKRVLNARDEGWEGGGDYPKKNRKCIYLYWADNFRFFRFKKQKLLFFSYFPFIILLTPHCKTLLGEYFSKGHWLDNQLLFI